MRFFLAFVTLLALAYANPLLNLTQEELAKKTWVVLAAGSFTFKDYRHQSDICHAYQVMRKLGIPEERIIVVMEDNIANNPLNKHPGKIFNEPNGPDVYQGVPHDYTGDQATKENYVRILLGEKMTVGSKKSLLSGPDDNVFIVFSGHGNTDYMCVLDGELHSNEWQIILNYMAEQKMFKNLIMYIESCFSGSLFYRLVLPPNVYVTTAAPVGQSSFSMFYDPDLDTSLADEYSYHWMHDTETNNNERHTFDEQFSYIQSQVGTSQVCRYGSKTLAKSTLKNFFGSSQIALAKPHQEVNISTAIPAIELPLYSARQQFERNKTDDNLKKLNKEIAVKTMVDNIGISIVSAAVPSVPRLATPPCTQCSSSCDCFYYCVKKYGDEYCSFECCNDQSCYEDPPSRFGAPHHQRLECLYTLTHEYYKHCSFKHPYISHNEHLFRRICKQKSANVTSAIEAIHTLCPDLHALL